MPANRFQFQFPDSTVLENTEATCEEALQVTDTFGIAFKPPAALRHLAMLLEDPPPGIMSDVSDIEEITSADQLDDLNDQIDELADGLYLDEFLRHFEWWVDVSRGALNGMAIHTTYGQQFPEMRERFRTMIGDVLSCYPKALAETIYFRAEQRDRLAHVALLKAYGLFRQAVLAFLSATWPGVDLSRLTEVP